MKRLFKGALLICLAALMAACDEDATLQQEQNGDKIKISLSFNVGNSPLSIGGPMTGTKGSGDDLFDAIYQGIVSGEIIASYELTFKNINTGASTSISGKWTENKTISLEKGTYTIYGISTAIGKGIYKDCSLSYQDEVTITPETRSITIKAQYDCSLLIVNDDSVDKILYYASQTDSTYFSQYQNLTYAFVKSAEDFTQGNNAYLKVYFNNGRSSIVDLGQINIQKGKYYLLENLNNYADAGLVLDIDKMENGDDNENDYYATAFFPATYADKTVAAWYAYTDKDKDKTKTEAVFLFTDQTFVVTKNKVYSKEDGRSPERGVEAIGTYQLTEGDFDNGKASVIISDGGTMTIVIRDGKLTTEMGDEVFIKQDNSKLPEALDPTSSGGDNQDDDLEAFFPTTYANKTISAWYSYFGSESAEGYELKYVAAIYFFDDNTFVSTISTIISGLNVNLEQREVSQNGTYRIIEGNFTTGKIAIIYNDNSITVDIQDGKLKVVDVEEVIIYTKQENSKVPEPSDPIENDSQGGGEVEQPIEFSIASGKSTRASSSAINSYIASNGGFKVWGFKKIDTDTDWRTVFDGTTVSSPDYGTTWTYSPLRYWDNAATSYLFYAAAPSDANWTVNGVTTNNNQSCGYFTTTSTLKGTNIADGTTSRFDSFNGAKTDGDIDKLIATPIVVYNAYFNQPVQFNFNHILSRLNVTISKDERLKDYNVIVKKLEIHNLKATGVFNESTASSQGGDNARWTESGNSVTYAAPADIKVTSTTASNQNSDPQYLIQSLVIPQDAAYESIALDGAAHTASDFFAETTAVSSTDNPYLVISYTIVDEMFTAYFNLAAAFGMDGTMDKTKLSFNEGWQNTLHITLSPDRINMCGEVSEWSTGENDYSLTID